MATFGNPFQFQSPPPRRSQQDLIAAQLLRQGSSTAPVQSGLEGIARALTGVVGGFVAGQAQNKRDTRETALQDTLGRALSASDSSVTPAQNPSVQGAVPQQTVFQVLAGNPDTARFGLARQLEQRDSDRNRQQAREDFVFQQENKVFRPKTPVPGRDIPFSDEVLAQREGLVPETNINVGSGKFGPIPKGMQLIETPEGARLVPIPGGPVEEKRTLTEAKAQTRNRIAIKDSLNVVNTIGRLREMVKGEGFLTPVTGFTGSLLSGVSGSPAADAKELVGTIEANIAFGKLSAMREASKTGGAVGQLSDDERKALAATVQSLKNSQTQEQFLTNLDEVEIHFADVVHGFSKLSKEQILSVDLDGLDDGSVKAYIRAIEIIEAAETANAR